MNNLYKIMNFIKHNIIKIGLVIVLIIAILVTINIVNNGTNKNSEIANDLIDKAKNYINTNNINIDEGLFLSFSDLDYQINSSCNQDGGIYISYDGNEYNYEPYYSCKKSMSNSIKNVINENKKIKEYFELFDDNPLYLDDINDFNDPGYILRKGTIEVTNNLKDKNGVYEINYNISYNNNYYTGTRIVIIKNKSNNSTDTDSVIKNVSNPIITLYGDALVNLRLGQEYKEIGFKAIDAKDGDITNKVITNNNINPNKVGTYTITYTATNSKNLSTIAKREIVITDTSTTAPSITLNGSSTINLKLGEKYIEPGFSATDKKDGNITDKVKVDNEVNVNKEGIYYITYTVTNSDNLKRNAIRKVIIKDNAITTPEITLKGNNTVYLKVGETYNEPGYSSYDDRDGDITKRVIVEGNVNVNKEGTYTINYKVTNSSNITIVKTRYVVVSKIPIPTISLNGNDTINLKIGEKYVEPGFTAYDEVDGNITNKVIVNNNVNTNNEGSYTISYTVTNSNKESTTVTRTVIVNKLSIPTLTLKGEKSITLNKGDKYTEPGFTAYDEKDGNITKNVQVSGTVNTNTPGTYYITYSITNSDNTTTSLTRTIIVKEEVKVFTYISNINNEEYTNESVTITLSITGDGYDYTILPNGNKSTNKTVMYFADENGTYTFKMYHVDGTYKVENVKITNIDKTKPTGTCTATKSDNNTIIKVVANDNFGISKYIYIDDGKVIQYTSNNQYTYDQKSSNNVSVKISDVSGNTSEITCLVVNNNNSNVVKPSSDEKIIKEESSDTLKITISKKSTYYITRIWAKNPYIQLNKFDSPAYGLILYKPSTMMKYALTKKNLENKLVVAFNASGFYLKDTYDSSSVSKYPAFDKTSVGTLVITDGVVKRNAYDKSFKTWYTMGIDKYNELRIFEDYKTTNSELKKEWANDVIGTGIRNTFTFASPLIEYGEKSSNTTNMPSPSSKLNRQAICQINKNNFAIITGKSLNRSNLINIMLDLKCETGMNLDGGGSIALLYKSAKSSEFETIIGNDRNLTEVGYFTE